MSYICLYKFLLIHLSSWALPTNIKATKINGRKKSNNKVDAKSKYMFPKIISIRGKNKSNKSPKELKKDLKTNLKEFVIKLINLIL
ncbi:MAG TPA: hypothetical protein DCR94_02550 [Firmicutes bacterium]|nr:hypothetical protein [Bacillota bacterium]